MLFNANYNATVLREGAFSTLQGSFESGQMNVIPLIFNSLGNTGITATAIIRLNENANNRFITAYVAPVINNYIIGQYASNALTINALSGESVALSFPFLGINPGTIITPTQLTPLNNAIGSTDNLGPLNTVVYNPLPINGSGQIASAVIDLIGSIILTLPNFSVQTTPTNNNATLTPSIILNTDASNLNLSIPTFTLSQTPTNIIIPVKFIVYFQLSGVDLNAELLYGVTSF